MSNKHEMNSFEKLMDEIREDQNSINQPGHFTGTGRVPLFLKNFFKSTSLMIFIGGFFLIPLIINLINDFSITAIINSMISTIISGILIVGGIIRLKNQH